MILVITLLYLHQIKYEKKHLKHLLTKNFKHLIKCKDKCQPNLIKMYFFHVLYILTIKFTFQQILG
jgi:hypothetical protein